jgi:hypothetical protein
VALALLYSTLLSSPRESGIGLGLIAAGVPFYFYWKGRIVQDTGSSGLEEGGGQPPDDQNGS